MPASHCALRRSGTITVQLCTSASEEEYPNILVAAAFHRTILPLRASATTTASRTLSRSWSMPKSCSLTPQITPPIRPTKSAFLERRLATFKLCPSSSVHKVSGVRNLVSATDLVFVTSRFLQPSFGRVALCESLAHHHRPTGCESANSGVVTLFADGDHAARERDAVGEVVHAGDLDNDSLVQTSS